MTPKEEQFSKNFKGLEDFRSEDWTPLAWACLINDVSEVKRLISKGADVNECSWAWIGTHPLLLATWRGHIAIVKMLIEAGVKDEKIINEAFVHACIYGRLDIAKYLVDIGANIEYLPDDNCSCSALVYAARLGEVNVVKFLLSAGAKNNLEDALRSAIGSGHIEIVKMLLATGIFVTPDDLIVACNGGHREIVELLLQAGADVNLHGNNGMTPLIMARKKGYKEIVNLLKSAGAKELNTTADSTNFKYEEPELFAEAKNKNWDKVKELLNTGSNPFDEYSDGCTFVEYILQSKDSPKEIKEIMYNKKLFMAVASGDEQEVGELLYLDDINLDITTALTSAVQSACTIYGDSPYNYIIEMLLEDGADINDKDSFGETALGIAEKIGNKKIINLLKSAGAKE